jgi:RNA polymerase sigma-70 factor (ECF subfamily)
MSPTPARPLCAAEDGAALSEALRRSERDQRLALLLAASARGDTTAFEAFYDETLAYARTVARRLLRGGDSDDLLADVYFEAWRSAARFDPQRGSAVTWLLTLVRSRTLDLLRHRAVHPGPPAHEVDAVEDATDAGDDPGDRLWRRQAGARLHAELQRLSGVERWLLGLAYFRELSHAEIARCTGLPLGTVKSHLLRAQHKLRCALAA